LDGAAASKVVVNAVERQARRKGMKSTVPDASARTPYMGSFLSD
jgi:hypothetical protein